MNVSSLTAGSVTSALGVLSRSSTGTTGTSVAAGKGVGAAVTLEPSEGKKLLDQLSALQSTDPDKAAKVASSVADQLEEAAKITGDQGLAKIAADFREVADGASVEDAFQPPSGAGCPPGMRGPPPGPPPSGSDDDDDDTTLDLLKQLSEVDNASESEATSSTEKSQADGTSASGRDAKVARAYASHATARTVDEILRSALAAA